MIRVISSSLHLIPSSSSSSSTPSSSSSSSSFLQSRYISATPHRRRQYYGHNNSRFLHIVRSSSTEDCNEEECAPEKEIGKLSLEWKAEEQTKVLGTYPPVARPAPKWTGYVEKDTAGQTNIYAVEPTVYVSENAISSNTAGDSMSGSEQTIMVAIAVGLSVVLTLGLVAQYGLGGGGAGSTDSFDGPALSYYITKFKAEVPGAVIDAPSASEAVQTSSTEEVVDSAAPAEAVQTSPTEEVVVPAIVDSTPPEANSGVVVEASAAVEPASTSTSPEAQ